MIKLYAFGPNLGMIDPSPFVLKIDLFLRLTKIKTKRICGFQNLKKAPKGKLPFIVDGDQTISDSMFIMEYLTEKYQVTLDDFLSTEEKATAYLLTKSLDENLYWCLLYSRWIDEHSWNKVKTAFFAKFPFHLKLIIPPLARKGVIDACKKQGLLNHSHNEIIAIANHSFQALSDLLGQKKYFFGEQPCSFDATAFAFLAQTIMVELDHEINKKARSYPNLVQYCKQIQQQYYET